MKLTQLIFILFPFALTACIPHSNAASETVQTGPITINNQHKRINTTECKDSDDWYLDGYRVGKSFSTQKAQMFQQRLDFCHLSTNKLSTQFKTNWEQGFAIGYNQSTSKAKNVKASVLN